MSIDVDLLVRDLLTDKNSYFIPPTLEPELGRKLLDFWQQTGLKKHAFITSSGTTSSYVKSYALSYKALKTNAESVNQLIGATHSDRWLGSLPIYHVGGLSIYIRAKLSGSKVIRYEHRWNVEHFTNTLIKNDIQFCSLVPTQLYDLVSNEIEAPKCLRAVFIGGDFLPDVIKLKAIELHWPLYLTFGMTEVCSQLATSHFLDEQQQNGFLKVLPVHDVKTIDNRLMVKSCALFTECYQFNGVQFESISSDFLDGYFVTNDLVQMEINDNTLIRPQGRFGNEIKIKGRLVNIMMLKNSFAKTCEDMHIFNQAEIVIVPDSRQGKQLELWLENSLKDLEEKLKEVIKTESDNLLKVSRVQYFDKLPRTKLGKLKMNA